MVEPRFDKYQKKNCYFCNKLLSKNTGCFYLVMDRRGRMTPFIPGVQNQVLIYCSEEHRNESINLLKRDLYITIKELGEMKGGRHR